MKSLIYSKKKYPYVLGLCEWCQKDIIIKNSSFDKPGRKFCSKSCRTSSTNKNKVWTPKQKGIVSKRMKELHSGKEKTAQHRSKMSEANRGKKSHFWRGGLTEENKILRNSLEYRNWRDAVYKRDNYTCVECGAKSKKGKAVILNADHIKPWSLYPVLRFQVSNGRTLCINCHKKTETFGLKVA